MNLMNIESSDSSFSFVSEEHGLIADSARKLFEDLAASDAQSRQQKHRRIDADEVGSALSELGLFSTQADDAAMWSAQIQVLVARESGAASLPYPVVESLASHAVALRAGIGGSLRADQRYTLASGADASIKRPMLREGQIGGRAVRVPFAEASAGIWFRAEMVTGKVLALIDACDPGIEWSAVQSVEADYPLFDANLSRIKPLQVLDRLDDGTCAIGFLHRRASLLAAAEISGACRRLVTMTRDYLLTRTQFGHVLGSHQALRHTVSDAHVRVEAMISAIDYAAAACDAGADDADAAVAAAKYYAGRSGKLVAETALQLHGAIGYTMEFPLQLLMRRVLRLGASHGSSRQQGEKLFTAFQALA